MLRFNFFFFLIFNSIQSQQVRGPSNRPDHTYKFNVHVCTYIQQTLCTLCSGFYRYPFSAGWTEAIRGKASCSRTQHDGTWRGSNPRPCGHETDALPLSHHVPMKCDQSAISARVNTMLHTDTSIHVILYIVYVCNPEILIHQSLPVCHRYIVWDINTPVPTCLSPLYCECNSRNPVKFDLCSFSSHVAILCLYYLYTVWALLSGHTGSLCIPSPAILQLVIRLYWWICGCI
jgi:hypothetical protein